MLEALGKHLWLLLTLAVPGLFTYGAWRLLLVLVPSTRLDAQALAQIDDSALLTTALIMAIALAQQAFAIALEFGLWLIARARRRRWPYFHALVHRRFALAARGRLSAEATRIIGNFFLSLNVAVGVGLLLLYFHGYEGLPWGHWLSNALLALAAAAVLTAFFRGMNAVAVIRLEA